jgi:hypothetical protein
MFFNVGGLMFVLMISRIFVNDVTCFFHSVNTNIQRIIWPNKPVEEEENETLSNNLTLEPAKPPVKYEDKYMDILKRQKTDALEQRIPNKANKVMEYTPLGNVLMWYEPDKESFHFHSDSTIPYRFLEVVARKYVTTFHCPHLYIDMEEEVELAKRKLQEKKEEKERKQREMEEQTKIEQAQSNSNPINSTKPKEKSNVFAKFKDYNKVQSKTSAAAPKVVTTTKENEDLILKENANRFTYDGRFSNFQMLVKVDRRVVDKRLNMSFAEFKKMMMKNNL